jgi:outer membrane biosynthesis protein TonB
METTLEPERRINNPVSLNPESGPSIVSVRQFALNQIGSRLAAEPSLVASCWAQIGTPEEHPDLTVIYCSIRRNLQTLVLLEFVAGETLEGLVRRTDPAACEREIPLFCRILDAYEGSKRAPGELPSPVGLELIDFGVGRAGASLTSKFHGAVLVSPQGTAVDQVVGEYGGSRSQVFAALMELSAKLPGELPRTAAYGPVNLTGVATCSLGGGKASPSEVAAPVAQSPVKTVSAARKKADSYLIAVGTMLLTLLVLYGVGGFLSKRTQPAADRDKLVLPAIASESPVAPVEEDATAPPATPPQPNPWQSHTAKKSAAAVARTARSAKRPVPSIVVARGAKPIRQTDLLYPIEAQNEHVSGLVEMQLTIAEDGSVQSPRVVSGDPLLRAGLTEEVSKWVFQPLRVDGKPVPMTTELTLRFNLNP